MPDLIFKQVWSQIDERTTLVCLNAAGQVRPVDVPFDTLLGQYDAPPFHMGCRSISLPYLMGQTSTQRSDANAELQRRPVAERDARKAKLPPRPRPRKRITPPRRKRRTPKK